MGESVKIRQKYLPVEWIHGGGFHVLVFKNGLTGPPAVCHVEMGQDQEMS